MTTHTTASNNTTPVAPALAAAYDALLANIALRPSLKAATVVSDIRLTGFSITVKHGFLTASLDLTLTAPPRWTYRASNAVDGDSKATLQVGERWGVTGSSKLRVNGIALKTVATSKKANEVVGILAGALAREQYEKDVRDQRQASAQAIETLAQTVARDSGLHRDDFVVAPGVWSNNTLQLRFTRLTAEEVAVAAQAVADLREERRQEREAAAQ